MRVYVFITPLRSTPLHFTSLYFRRGHAHDLVALTLKSPSDAVKHLIRLLRDPTTTPDLHVCLQASVKLPAHY